MAYPFDENNSTEGYEERLRYFYEEYSAQIKKQLLAKNLIKPQNVYDVLYANQREHLLAKNVPANTDLEEKSKSIRDALVAKLVTENLDLENYSENFRKSLLARNTLAFSLDDLLSKSENVRKNLLSKNVEEQTDLEKFSERFRNDNIAKNKAPWKVIDDIEDPNDRFRENNIAKNVPSNYDIDKNSSEFRQNNVAKNKPTDSDLEKDSKSYRENNVAANKSEESDLETDSKEFRQNNIAANKPATTDLDKISEQYRDNNVAANKPATTDLDKISEPYRQNNVAANKPDESDLETDSESFRKNNTAANKPATTDLDTISEQYRDNNVAANKPATTDLDTISEPYRENNVAANKPDESDLEKDSETYRQNNVSANKPATTDLDKISEPYRQNNISANKPEESDLENSSKEFRQNNISANKPVTTDLDTISEPYRENNVSANKPEESDLENDSKDFRQNNVSANKPVTTDLENDSRNFRQNNVSANKPKTSDLEKDSEPAREDNLSFNKPNTSDLATDSVPFYENNVAANTPNVTDLETDSVPFYQNNVAANTPNVTDLETDSVPFWQDNMSANVPNSSDLETDSVPYWQDNVSANVPNSSDLASDSVPYWQNNVSANVPNNSDLLSDSNSYLQNNTSANVPNGSNLLTDSYPYYQNNTSPNVPSESDLLTDSKDTRDYVISANVPKNSDLEKDSELFRQNNLSKNPPSLTLGVNVEGLGTSTFLGISRVYTQGLLFRQILLSKNEFVPGSALLPSSNEYGSISDQFTLLSATRGANTNKKIVNSSYSDYQPSTLNTIRKNAEFVRTVQQKLQGFYGTNPDKLVSIDKDVPFSDSPMSVDIKNPLGHVWSSPVNSTTARVTYQDGYITSNIRNYNLERNLYNLNRLQPAGTEGFSNLTNFQDSDGFQDLIQRTVGSLKGNLRNSSQFASNGTPNSVIQKNNGLYLGDSAENLMKPGQIDAPVGTAASMMSKTEAGNPLNNSDFDLGNRGVKNIINTIKNDPASKFSINFDVQNSKKFVINQKNGEPIYSRQKYSYANPYAPKEAFKLVFSLKNYSSGDVLYFPPYIQSFQNSDSANWNSINFLGRPEPVYTYNNSTRDGSITFFVLTDYTQSVIIGKNYNEDDLPDVKFSPNKHFTQKDYNQNTNRRKTQEEQDAVQKNNNKAQAELNNGIVQLNGAPEQNVLQQQADRNKAENNKIQEQQERRLVQDNTPTNYVESNSKINNVYNLSLNTNLSIQGNGEYVSGPQNTINALNQMIQSELMFQPSYFSGDKVDFERRMDFLSKLTKPARADANFGFSFTRPPICHIHLGDWWNHDIVVNSVSVDYTDAPWTLGDGRVQPLWASVTISFNFIGPYHGQHGDPVLSTDKHGVYSRRQR